MNWAERIIEGAGDSAIWLRGVLLGEWEDNKSLSQCVTDALAGFIPGVGNILAFRDLIAIIVRLAKYPKKREQVEEWMLLIAMLLPLALTLGGAAIAGVGALVGAELGAFLRALTLLLIKNGGTGLKTLVEFFQHHGYGDVIGALKGVKFGSYANIVTKACTQQLIKLTNLINELQTRLRQLTQLPDWLPGREALEQAQRKLDQWIESIRALQKTAYEMLPAALTELDNRLGKLLAGDISAATQTRHTVTAGIKTEKVERAQPVSSDVDAGVQQAQTPGVPEPGNVRRVKERRLVLSVVNKTDAEYRLASSKGIPVGAKPYHEGKTVCENQPLTSRSWDKQSLKVQGGYPDLAAKNRKGEPMTKYDTFASLEPYDVKPGEKIVRVVGPKNPDTGSSWTRELPEDGRQFRSGTSVKEAWNSDGRYVDIDVPPKGDPVWQEIHQVRRQRATAADFDPDQVPYEETLKTWKGTASAQRYEYKDPETGKVIKEDFYMEGGDEQLYVDPAELKVLEKHQKFGDRKPTNFKDFDPTIKNPDGTFGNIVPTGGLIFEQVPKGEAILASKGGSK